MASGSSRGAPAGPHRRLRIVWLIVAAAVAGQDGCAPAPHQDRAPLPPERYWDPDLTCDDGGRPYIVALTQDTSGVVRFFFASAPSGGEVWTVADPAPFGRAPRGRRRPRLAAGRDGEVYCLWEDSRSGRVDLYFNRSQDGGGTWLAEDAQLNTNPPGVSHLSAPHLACDDHGSVYAVWRDDRDGFDAFYANGSRDYGSTWRDRDVRITGIGFGTKADPRLACDSFGNVYLAWVEERDGGRHVFFNASFDRGDTWMLRDVALGDAGFAFGVDLVALDNGSVIAAWAESGPGGERIFAARSTDRGRFWEPPRTLRVAGLRADATVPQVVADGGDHVYVAWHATATDGTSRIAVASSGDSGTQFEFTVVRPPGPLADPDLLGARRSLLSPFRIACDRSGNTYLAWTERGVGTYRVAVDRLSGYGRIWLQLQSPAALEAYAPVQPVPPRLACDDFGHVYLLWNSGHALHAAASPFYADSGWRHRAF